MIRDAISGANAIAAEELLRWNEYLVKSAKDRSEGGGDPNPPAYRPPDPFVICPGMTLDSLSPYRSIFSPWYWTSRAASYVSYSLGMTSSPSPRPNLSSTFSRSPQTKLSPIFINAEDITIK